MTFDLSQGPWWVGGAYGSESQFPVPPVMGSGTRKVGGTSPSPERVGVASQLTKQSGCGLRQEVGGASSERKGLWNTSITIIL